MTSAGYFEDLATTSSLDFAAAYGRRFGPDAPCSTAWASRVTRACDF